MASVLDQGLDDGRSWTGVGSLSAPSSPLNYLLPTSLLEGQPSSGILFVAGNVGFTRLSGSNPFVQRSDDDGAHWTDASQGLPGTTQGPAVTAIAIDPTSSQTLYAAASGA